MDCSAYCTSASYDISGLYDTLSSKYECTMFRNVVHVNYPLDNDKTTDVFYFPYGTMVCWDADMHQGLQFLEETRPFQHQPNEIVEDEGYRYEYGEEAKIEKDLIILPNEEILTKLAVSYALSQSVKLGAFEQTIVKTFENTRHIPENLAAEGTIPLSRKAIRQEMGQLFLKRSSINLHIDVLDTPDFFWDYPNLESLYVIAAGELEIETRTEVLNHRLDVVRELFEVLGNELNHQHSSRLEWIIIWLIVIEVILTLTHDFFKWI